MEHDDSSTLQCEAALPSSPVALSSTPVALGLLSPKRSSRKEKRNPSVTPRRFGRFFTPRHSQPITGRRILANLDATSINRQPTPPSSDPIVPLSPCLEVRSDSRYEDEREDSTEPLIKRRKLLSSDEVIPSLRLSQLVSTLPPQEGSDVAQDLPDILGESRKATLRHFFRASRSLDSTPKEDEMVFDKAFDIAAGPRQILVPDNYSPQPIRKFANRGLQADIMARELRTSWAGQPQGLYGLATDPRSQTASFYSNSSDVHRCTAYAGQGDTIPFTLASAHCSPITAIGDEQGYVRLMRTTSVDRDSGVDETNSKISSHFFVYNNAVMDLDFSGDDLRLATACGDRTGRIVDVVTGQVAVHLRDEHCDNLRQIAFQPGREAGDVVVTTDRDGCINVWDLRCSSMPVNTFSSDRHGINSRNNSLPIYPARVTNTIENAHWRKVNNVTSTASVTAVRWFPAGREHLLLSASEANACIKLWDTRYIKPRRQHDSIPLAVTEPPPIHTRRDYGVTSLSLSGDGGRLYAVCRDSTVYAYSVAHLLLGHAPELEENAIKRRPAGARGLGPIYGFRNPSLGTHSFYVKSALRPASGVSPELLAVGSSNFTPVLFPTDERFMHSACAGAMDSASRRSVPTTRLSMPSEDMSMPIFRTGTPLTSGHTHEVTMVDWSSDGRLVTASDDRTVRHWQDDDSSRARFLRQVGNFGPERYMAGWADVAHDWDLDDEG